MEVRPQRETVTVHRGTEIQGIVGEAGHTKIRDSRRQTAEEERVTEQSPRWGAVG